MLYNVIWTTGQIMIIFKIKAQFICHNVCEISLRIFANENLTKEWRQTFGDVDNYTTNEVIIEVSIVLEIHFESCLMTTFNDLLSEVANSHLDTSSESLISTYKTITCVITQ